MGLVTLDQFVFGGVDSRSNPLNLPRDRCLRCLNWIITEAGNLQLRYGYAVTNQVTASSSRIVNFCSYKKLDGTRLLVFFDGTTPKTMNLATGVVTTPTVKGTAFASSAKGTFTFVNNRLHFYNGTDKKWFDGTFWRDIGIRAPTAGEANAVGVAIGAADANAIVASSVGGAQPGYQFWMAYYNPTTNDIGTAVKIGSRLVPTVANDFNLTTLPDLSGIDTEWVKLIGRTGDGGQVAYACADTSGNWFTVANGSTTGTVNVPNIDGNAEMPSRNTQPVAFDKAVLAGDYVYGNQAGSATIYRSGSASLKRQGVFPGNPEECFASNDSETFPTNQAVSCIAEENQDLWVWSLTDMAILASDQSGAMGWLGPWNIGNAGQRAGCHTPYGRFWVSGDKQLCTMSESGPISVSGEYETALLAKIGDANLSAVETKYFRDASKNIDHIVINCLDSNNAPFHVIHDFKLKDARSPFGQAYERQYQSLLSTVHSIEQVRDNSDKMKIWAGASDGKLYELYNGANDNGTEYSADLIALLNGGKKRPSLPYIAWNGDGAATIAVGKTLKTTLTAGTDFNFQALDTETMPGGEDDYFFRATLPEPEIRNVYVRIQLTSHSADGNLDLNSPPHVPVENYGRVYAAMPAIGEGRGTP
jgi:hypothetical protein